jgi:gamma-glutamyltranspeptidase/glutathione hydrolase
MAGMRRMLPALLLLLHAPARSQDRFQARSMVISDRGIVATSQTLASQAGAQTLARGGSAMDAAIAANAVLGVVEPQSCGLGGDLFAIHWDARTGKLTAINASGWAPKALTIDVLKKLGHTTMPQDGVHSITVPGAVDGWSKLHKKFGKLPWRDLFQPAIYYAEHGYPVTEQISVGWKGEEAKLAKNENARKTLLPENAAPPLGSVFRNPQLASAYRMLAQDGAPVFYRGPIAKAILQTTDRLGGKLAAADMAEFESEWVEPISTEYRGWKVYELPPNGQGIAAIEMLNLFSLFPLPTYDPRGLTELHTQMEAQKLAFADLRRYIADPRFSKQPVGGLISMDYARERSKLMDPATARCDVAPGNPPNIGGDTIYLSAVDREGNIVSLIQSLYLNFGSAVVVDGYGFPLQNRGGLFDLDAEHPNALAPRKRPFHTIIPAFMEKGDTHIGFGIMGGLNQAQAHAQFVSNVADHGMNIQMALEAPRFTKTTWGGCDFLIESRIPADIRNALTARGHDLKVVADFGNLMGGGQAVLHDSSKKVNYGGSDPRKDGAAVPEAPAFWK